VVEVLKDGDAFHNNCARGLQLKSAMLVAVSHGVEELSPEQSALAVQTHEQGHQPAVVLASGLPADREMVAERSGIWLREAVRSTQRAVCTVHT